jgi:hypothetical protein
MHVCIVRIRVCETVKTQDGVYSISREMANQATRSVSSAARLLGPPRREADRQPSISTTVKGKNRLEPAKGTAQHARTHAS